jgi:hypothetical protein
MNKVNNRRVREVDDRRARKKDPLACVAAVSAVINELGGHFFPDGVKEKKLRSFLWAVRHVERGGNRTLRGPRGQFQFEQVVRGGKLLKEILSRQTNGRVSPARFVTRYLKILDFPGDVTSALEAGDITLDEAHTLARLTGEALNCTGYEARAVRGDILRHHLAKGKSQNALRRRVREQLGFELPETADKLSSEIKRRVAESDLLLEIDPSDSRHLLWETVKELVFTMRSVDELDLDDKLRDEILTNVSIAQTSLNKAVRRKQQRLEASQPRRKLIV